MLYVVDPRRTSSAKRADGWLSVRVGTDVALANAVGHVIVRDGLVNEPLRRPNATAHYDDWRSTPCPVDALRAPRPSPACPPRSSSRMARDYARADRAVICWTLGITEHHNAVDNVLARSSTRARSPATSGAGARAQPCARAEQRPGGGDMGALPTSSRLPGRRGPRRARALGLWGATIPPRKGWTLTEMFEAMEHGAPPRGVLRRREPRAERGGFEAGGAPPRRLDHLVARTSSSRPRMATWCSRPAAWSCEGEGTVTNSERRVQRVRGVARPPGDARDDLWILAELSRLGLDLGHPPRARVWDEMRAESPMHRGMSYEKLPRALGGIQWPCPTRPRSARPSPREACGAEPRVGPAAPHGGAARRAGRPDHRRVPADADHRAPASTHYNTGVQTGLRFADAPRGDGRPLARRRARLGVSDGQRVRVVRRGAVVAPARIDDGLPAGTVFMTFRFPDEVDTNALTIDATDPRSGTAESSRPPCESRGCPRADRITGASRKR